MSQDGKIIVVLDDSNAESGSELEFDDASVDPMVQDRGLGSHATALSSPQQGSNLSDNCSSSGGDIADPVGDDLNSAASDELNDDMIYAAHIVRNLQLVSTKLPSVPKKLTIIP